MRHGLSDKELELLQAIADGHSQKELRSRPGMSRSALAWRLRCLVAKSAARNLTHLIAMLLRAKVLR